MARAPRNRPHFHVEGGGQAEPYTSPRLVITGLPPARVRAAHAQKLERAIGSAVADARRKLAARDEAVAEGEKGFYLEFEIPVAERAAVEGLENRPAAIELVAVRPVADGDEIVSATVFVPERSAEFFSLKITAYRDENTKTGKHEMNSMQPCGHPSPRPSQPASQPIHESLVLTVRAVFLCVTKCVFCPLEWK